MLRLGIADEVSVFLAVVVLPSREQFVAMAIAQLAKKQVSAVLNGTVAQRIHANADRQTAKRIAVLGARKHRSLIAQPPDVAKKSKDQQRASADGNRDLCAGKTHPERDFIWMARDGKITSGVCGRTCTSGKLARGYLFLFLLKPFHQIQIRQQTAVAVHIRFAIRCG